MSFATAIEIFRQVAESLRANKLRSILASLGVVIGISLVILMAYALSGLDLALAKTFNIIGRDMLYVDKWDWAGGKSWKLLRQRKDISLEQAQELVDRLTTAELAVPIARKWGVRVKYESDVYEGISLQGVTSKYALTPAGSVEQGRFFSSFEDEYSKNVAVLGYRVYETMFPNGGGIGKTIKINGHKFKVIGYIERRGVLFIDFVDHLIFIPLSNFLGKFGDEHRSLSIAVKAPSESTLDEVRSETRGLMRTIRNIHPSDEDDFSINESKAFEETVESFQAGIWSVGIGMTILSFVVGIIGIMNIMFVSVAERTKEIGIRKAIGARKNAILLQFIFESMTLCFIGALVSFIFSSLVILGLSHFLPIWWDPDLDFLPATLSGNMFLITTIISLFVGMLAGLIPAIRASNLDPVDALRYE